MKKNWLALCLWALLFAAVLPADAFGASGKTRILFVGDSIVRGRITKTTKAEDTIPSIVAKKLGVICRNEGIDGARVTRTGNKMNSVVKRILDNRHHLEKYQVIVLLAGTNDHGHNIPKGTINDRSTKTFYGAWNCIFKYIRKYNPKAKVVVVTPIYKTQLKKGFTGMGFNMRNKAGFTLSAYIKAERAIAKKYGAYCFDPAREKVITSEDSYLYLRDGLHPNQAGYRLLGNALAKFLKPIIRK